MNKLAHLLFIDRRTRDGPRRARHNPRMPCAREWLCRIPRPRTRRCALGRAGGALLRCNERSAQKAEARENHRPLESFFNACPELIHRSRFPLEVAPIGSGILARPAPHRARNCRFRGSPVARHFSAKCAAPRTLGVLRALPDCVQNLFPSFFRAWLRFVPAADCANVFCL